MSNYGNRPIASSSTSQCITGIVNASSRRRRQRISRERRERRQLMQTLQNILPNAHDGMSQLEILQRVMQHIAYLENEVKAMNLAFLDEKENYSPTIEQRCADINATTKTNINSNNACPKSEDHQPESTSHTGSTNSRKS